MTIQQEHWNTPAQGGNRRISVIGCGRWGTFLAWYLERSGQQVCLYGREGSARMEALVATRTNGVTTLPESVRLTHSLAEALERDTVVISVGAQGLRGLLREIAALCPGGEGKRLVLCMKGLEAGTGKRLTTLVEEELPQTEASGVIAEIRSAVVDGNTWYYLQLSDGTVYYTISAAEAPEAVILNVGDTVTVKYAEGEGSILQAYSVAKAVPAA